MDRKSSRRTHRRLAYITITLIAAGCASLICLFCASGCGRRACATKDYISAMHMQTMDGRQILLRFRIRYLMEYEKENPAGIPWEECHLGPGKLFESMVRMKLHTWMRKDYEDQEKMDDQLKSIWWELNGITPDTGMRIHEIVFIGLEDEISMDRRVL